MFVYFILGTLISAIGFFSDMTVSREKVRDAGNSGGALGSKCASLTYSFTYFLVYLLACLPNVNPHDRVCSCHYFQ